MSQATDYSVANDSGANVRADINSIFAAIKTANSGATEPGNTAAYMLWVDTANGVLKMRNAANDGWVTLAIDIATQTITTGSIAEANAGSGVTIDGLTLKDGGFDLSGTDADGDMYYRASSALARLAKGSATYLLAMNSGATAPEWINPNTVGFPSTTKMLFRQSAAPTGWTKETASTYDDNLLRVVTSTSWSVGEKGTTATSSLATTTHTHTHSHTHTGPSHNHIWMNYTSEVTAVTTYDSAGSSLALPRANVENSTSWNYIQVANGTGATQYNTFGADVYTSNDGTQTSGAASTATTSATNAFSPRYVDVIFASKN